MSDALHTIRMSQLTYSSVDTEINHPFDLCRLASRSARVRAARRGPSTTSPTTQPSRRAAQVAHKMREAYWCIRWLAATAMASAALMLCRLQRRARGAPERSFSTKAKLSALLNTARALSSAKGLEAAVECVEFTLAAGSK